MTATRTLLTLAAVVVVTACASAGKRLEQGIEAETAGSFYEASMRYAEALEKDADLSEARARLLEAGDSAIRTGLSEAEANLRAGRDVSAAEGFMALDRLLGRVRGVGVRLPLPEDYAGRRRTTFDRAIDELLGESTSAVVAGRWGAGRSALARIRRDFEPSAEQRRRSEESESELLLDWAEEEASSGRPRRAYDLAGEALGAVSPTPAGLADEAEALRERAVADGTRTVAVLPVTTTAPVRERMDADLDQQLSDLLELDHWRSPPVFVVVADPVLVRRAARRWAPLGASPRLGRVLDDVGADFGALVELVGLEATESDLRREVHEARTVDGRTTAWTEERGRLTLTIEARVTVVDPSGQEVGDVRARATENARFERGIYRGDPRDLDLSRGERRLFDPVLLRRQRAALEETVVAELAGRVADQLFSRVLSRIP